ncbi:hypothetical protein FIBSPDRAFT_1041203 [Athelia psychrophila]|uniref:F-box domain-containing protein n=1 Tax=Athelia psychrophila TaxID=1759441 RepID=A0A166P8T5_9AGAM|nr:hypothetical protein FIBSPDRAFT_1041203 [Fibularhizoctonia sp. CBS 109695]
MSERQTTPPPPPGHRIPSELLSEILSQTTPTLRYGRISERCSIIALSHVCRHWRSVALATPSLWTYILFRCGQNGIPRELACNRAWLLRSGQESLAIYIDTSYSRAASKSAIELLLPHSLRWREIKAHTFDVDARIFSQIRGRIPMLESAELDIAGSKTYINSTMPSALEAHLTQDLHHILLSASNLSFLAVTLRRTLARVVETITNSTISTLHLFTSAFNTDREDTTEYFLDHLALPALRNLRAASNPGRSVISFVSRSVCRLASLHIRMFATPEFVELMELLPGLRELSVEFKDVRLWDAMVECFTFTHDRHLTPNLRSLTMRWPLSTDKVSLQNFADMVESRWRPLGAALPVDASSIRSPLRHVKVDRCKPKAIVDASSTCPRLRKFLEEGLDVMLLSNDLSPRELL